ncbi:hypothetical protein C4D60_Mb01t11420 [Musa balbisiana]|uniref:Uncharacterized protein n=1 Tax=Musa balbisiana TaxID=52838 RepID=A0A4S8JLS3_MUSBA|nr:hypothetical protein C4D60_Mb01t11420 [Musa balbisiana]
MDIDQGFCLKVPALSYILVLVAVSYKEDKLEAHGSQLSHTSWVLVAVSYKEDKLEAHVLEIHCAFIAIEVGLVFHVYKLISEHK